MRRYRLIDDATGRFAGYADIELTEQLSADVPPVPPPPSAPLETRSPGRPGEYTEVIAAAVRSLGNLGRFKTKRSAEREVQRHIAAAGAKVPDRTTVRRHLDALAHKWSQNPDHASLAPYVEQTPGAPERQRYRPGGTYRSARTSRQR